MGSSREKDQRGETRHRVAPVDLEDDVDSIGLGLLAYTPRQQFRSTLGHACMSCHYLKATDRPTRESPDKSAPSAC